MSASPSNSDNPAPTPPAVRDRRMQPTGVIPRRLQTWLMAGLAAVIVLVILITGRSQPPARVPAGPRPADATLAPADRIRTFAEQLAAEAARAAAADRQAADEGPKAATANSREAHAVTPAPLPPDRGLLADNIVLSRRPPADAPTRPPALSTMTPAVPTPPASPAASAIENQLAVLEQAIARLPAAALAPRAPVPSLASAPPASAPPDPPPAPAPPAKTPAPGAGGVRLYRVYEGSLIETVLLTRLDGTLASPLVCLVTTPVYSPDRQHVLIPAGARVLGAASPVQAWGDTRLAVSFHRLLMPDGRSYSLDAFKGLDTVGEAGLTERINHHYLQVFGASIAIGGLSGLSQFNTRVGLDAANFSDEFRQSAGAGLASSASRVLDRYLNVLPTITVREGYRVKVYLTNDFDLPAYAPEGDPR